MLKKIFGPIAGAAIIGGVVLSSGPTEKYTTLEDALSASVQLGDYCSATSIEDPDLSDGEQLTFITAKHCMDSKDVEGGILKIRVPTVVGNDYSKLTDVYVIIKSISKKSDVVLLQNYDPKKKDLLPKVHVYDGLPKAGDQAYAFGYPRGESLTVSFGYLGYIIENFNLSDISKSGRWQKSTDAVQGGSSGGGMMIKTENGYELVGTCTWGYRGDEGSSYWTPLDEIRAFLAEPHTGEAPSVPEKT